LFSEDGGGVKMKVADGHHPQNVPGSAEEAVDQLQASEKLIAGMSNFLSSIR